MARLIDSIQGAGEVWATLLRQMETRGLPHALAFAGTPGVGKKMVAWALAQALVCEAAENRPCGVCPGCRRIENKQSESVLFLEPEKGVLKLEATQQVLHFLTLQRISRARVVIIDGAQSLNPQAANALLKVLEEPPPQTYFILVVAELAQLMPTLRSRVQVLRFAPLPDAVIATAVAAPWMVQSARGSFAKLEAFANADSEALRQLTLEFLSQSLAGEREALDRLLDQTKDRNACLSVIHFLQQFLRDWCVVGLGDVIHSDFSARFAALPALRPEDKIELWRKAFALEQDFVAHVDRTLLLQNFYYRLKESA